MEQHVERWRTRVRFAEGRYSLRTQGGRKLPVVPECPDERFIVKRIGAEVFLIDKLWQVFTRTELAIEWRQRMIMARAMVMSVTVIVIVGPGTDDFRMARFRRLRG